MIQYCKMITTVILVNTFITSHTCYSFGALGENCKDLLSNFQIYNSVLLSIVNIKYIIAPELTV